MSFEANEGTRFTIMSNNGTFKVVREYMEDYCTRADLKHIVSNAFNNISYTNMVADRLINGYFVGAKLYDIEELNKLLSKLDSTVVVTGKGFHLGMGTEEFDRLISRMLYIAKKWAELCHYTLLTTTGVQRVNYMHEVIEDRFEMTYTTNYMDMAMTLNNKQMAIKTVARIENRMEF